MRIALFTGLLIAVFSLVASGEGFKPEDFRPAIPSRAKLSYDWSLSRYPGQRMHLYWDKKLGYFVYSYVITRDLVKSQIQKVIDAQGITDPQRIQEVINYYLDITPDEREAIFVLYFKAPSISNRYFVNELADFENSIYLEYGSKKLEKHVEWARKQMEKERREYPTKEELIYEGGIRPLFVDVEGDYLYYPERFVLKDQEWDPLVNGYRWVIAYRFNDEDIARIEELLLNEIPVNFSLVISEPTMFEYKELPKLHQYQILRMIDPEFVEFMEALGEMSPAKDRTKVKPKYWLK